MNMNRCRIFAITLFFALSSSMVSSSLADNWPSWRGPHGNGVADGSGYATEWSESENIAWKVEMPAPGGSTPAIWGDLLFVTCPGPTPEADQQPAKAKAADNEVLCFNRDGERKWATPLGKERAGKHKKGSGSNPSPVTDGAHVYCYFKSGDVACLDFDGKVVWQHNLQKEYGEDTLWWDLGTSPVLTEKALVIAVVQSGPSYLVAYDKTSGDVLWKQDRMLDAPEEAAQTYATPIVFGAGDDERIIVLGADHVTGHDANTGVELWRVGDLNPRQEKFFRSISSPVLSNEGLIIAPYARGTTLTAIRVGGSGDVRKTHVAWENEGLSSDVPTPAVKDGRVFVLSDKGTIAALHVLTGETIWKGSLPKNRNAYSASPVVVDSNIYVTREDATTFVLDVNEFNVVAENKLDDRVVATPVFLDGRIYLRGSASLYCIGE